MAARHSGDHRVAHNVNRRCGARTFCLGERERTSLNARASGIPRIGLHDDLVAIDIMHASVEHRAGHDVEEDFRIKPAFADHRDDFAKRLQRRCRHHVAKQFDEVCVCRIGTDCKRSLPEAFEERTATFDVGRSAGGDDKQLARFCGIRIPEDRRGDVALSVTGMLAWRDQSPLMCLLCSWKDVLRRALTPKRYRRYRGLLARDYFANGVVVREHGDNDLTVEKIGDVCCGLEADRREFVHLLRATTYATT